MLDLQIFDTTFIEISGGPVPLHPPPFSGVQNYKFNKLTIFSAFHSNSLAHLRRALYMECTLDYLRSIFGLLHGFTYQMHVFCFMKKFFLAQYWNFLNFSYCDLVFIWYSKFLLPVFGQFHVADIMAQ